MIIHQKFYSLWTILREQSIRAYRKADVLKSFRSLKVSLIYASSICLPEFSFEIFFSYLISFPTFRGFPPWLCWISFYSPSWVASNGVYHAWRSFRSGKFARSVINCIFQTLNFLYPGSPGGWDCIICLNLFQMIFLKFPQGLSLEVLCTLESVNYFDMYVKISSHSQL